jgi:hypothetical protein
LKALLKIMDECVITQGAIDARIPANSGQEILLIIIL